MGKSILFVWNNLRAIQNLLCPIAWGWTGSEDGLSPFWSELPETSEASHYQLIRGGCKKSCSGHCKCKIADMLYTELCACAGDC